MDHNFKIVTAFLIAVDSKTDKMMNGYTVQLLSIASN